MALALLTVRWLMAEKNASPCSKAAPRITRALAMVAAAAGAGAMLAGCGGPVPNASRLPLLARRRVARVGVERGARTRIVVASWYGPRFDGKRTSSGEIFHQNALTAASPALPLGSRVRVTNLVNHKSVVVRINDRGPHVRGRAIDLSRRAARAIGISHRGVALVKLERLRVRSSSQTAKAPTPRRLSRRSTGRKAG